MKYIRAWATPLTIGAFGFMAVTGLLMFFHLDQGFNKLAHQWFGWVLITGVVAHVTLNWNSFWRYFRTSNLARGIAVASVVLIAVTYSAPVPPGSGKGRGAAVLAMKAITHAPIERVAALTGKTAAQLIDELSKAGIALSGTEATIAGAIGDDRELEAKAMSVLFR
jgi:hypothetical protein